MLTTALRDARGQCARVGGRRLKTWAAAYPTVLAVQWGLPERWRSAALPWRTLALTAAVVPILVYVALPIVERVVARIAVSFRERSQRGSG